MIQCACNARSLCTQVAAACLWLSASRLGVVRGYRMIFIAVPDQCLYEATVLFVILFAHVVINFIYCRHCISEHILMCVQRRSTVCISYVLLG